MKKRSKSSSNKIYLLLALLMLLPVIYFIFLINLKLLPVLAGRNNTLADMISYQPKADISQGSGEITAVTYTGFFCSECRQFYSTTYQYLLERVETGRMRHYHNEFLSASDIMEKTLEYNASRYLYCQGSDTYWDTYNMFFTASEDDAKQVIDSISGDCYESQAPIEMQRRFDEMSLFGINTQPAIFIGIDGRDNAIIYGNPRTDVLNRTIRMKEITLGIE